MMIKVRVVQPDGRLGAEQEFDDLKVGDVFEAVSPGYDEAARAHTPTYDPPKAIRRRVVRGPEPCDPPGNMVVVCEMA